MNKSHSIQELQQIIVDAISTEAAKIKQTEPHNLYEPIAYTLDMGGKRLRPVMVLLACQAFGGEIEDAIPAALAIEIFHNFTLLHDDIMDHAEVRRNKPAVHIRYNENVAILSGDAMSIMAYQYLTKTESQNLQQVVQLFSKTAMEVCEGQQYDMDFEDTFEVSIEDYLKMIRLKTAVLIACSLKTGAIIAGASAVDAEHIYQFGINLGIAFQLQDDLLDVFADEEKFGKKIGGDIVANKKTFLLLKALEVANTSQKSQLMEWINEKEFDPAEKIESVKQIYLDLNLQDINQEMMDDFYQVALNELNTARLDPAQKNRILELGQLIMRRQH